MSEIEKQVTCLELSQQLKETGCEQESLWVWIWSAVDQSYILALDKDVNNNKTGGLLYGARSYFAAYTVAEGLNRLPCKLVFNVIGGKRKRYWLTILKIDNYWQIAYRLDCRGVYNEDYCVEGDHILANAVHKMWLYLNKEGLL